MPRSKKLRRNSGRYIPKYHEQLPFKIREENDVIEERALWDDWTDYRDGFRSNFCKIRFKRMMKQTRQFLNKRTWRKKRKDKFINK